MVVCLCMMDGACLLLPACCHPRGVEEVVDKFGDCERVRNTQKRSWSPFLLTKDTGHRVPCRGHL